jgi:hypothetical protein
VLTIAPRYARLTVAENEPFENVTESVRTLLQVCRMNKLGAAMIVSGQHRLDWRSSMRVALRFAAARTPLPRLDLALVVADAGPGGAEVLLVAKEAGLNCRVFPNESAALAWLKA